MNHTELIEEISARTGIDPIQCDKVIRTFEEVLSDGFAEKKWKSRTFDLAVKMMNSIKAGKDRRDADPEEGK